MERPLEPGIPYMMDWYQTNPESFVESAISRAVVRKGPSSGTLLESDTSGRILVFAVDGAYFAVPHPEIGIGLLFRCEEFKEGHGFASFLVDEPAVLQPTGSDWLVSERGLIRLIGSRNT
jgi:hypothetical protein